MTSFSGYYAYIRISTTKQGEGVSLDEQRDAIEAYAAKHELPISEWFEETITAAKRGRPLFGKMLSRLRKGHASGVIIHKIDRSARNLKDWADMGELIDRGVDVHFANEGLDLASRGGRLSADIQAIIAADYIRNLSDEVRKGIDGRLKQGLYPFGAPVGYLNCGKGKKKEIDPIKGPKVRRLFERYSTGLCSVKDLVWYAETIGLKNVRDGRLSVSGVWNVLRNPFYKGLIHLKSTGRSFKGIHEPLVPSALFEDVQRILSTRTNTKAVKHSYVFRRLFSCGHCRYSLVGERQKSHIYYRCHTTSCPTKSAREDAIDKAVLSQISLFGFPSFMREGLLKAIQATKGRTGEEQKAFERSLELQRRQVAAKLSRLADFALDGKLSDELFYTKQRSLLDEQRAIEETIQSAKADSDYLLREAERILELATGAELSYRRGGSAEKRNMVETITSNRFVKDNKVFVELREPFRDLVPVKKDHLCGLRRNVHRTCALIVDSLILSLRKRITREGFGGPSSP